MPQFTFTLISGVVSSNWLQKSNYNIRVVPITNSWVNQSLFQLPTLYSICSLQCTSTQVTWVLLGPQLVWDGLWTWTCTPWQPRELCSQLPAPTTGLARRWTHRNSKQSRTTPQLAETLGSLCVTRHCIYKLLSKLVSSV